MSPELFVIGFAVLALVAVAAIVYVMSTGEKKN